MHDALQASGWLLGEHGVTPGLRVGQPHTAAAAQRQAPRSANGNVLERRASTGSRPQNINGSLTPPTSSRRSQDEGLSQVLPYLHPSLSLPILPIPKCRPCLELAVGFCGQICHNLQTVQSPTILSNRAVALEHRFCPADTSSIFLALSPEDHVTKIPDVRKQHNNNRRAPPHNIMVPMARVEGSAPHVTKKHVSQALYLLAVVEAVELTAMTGHTNRECQIVMQQAVIHCSAPSCSFPAISAHTMPKEVDAQRIQ